MKYISTWGRFLIESHFSCIYFSSEIFISRGVQKNWFSRVAFSPCAPRMLTRVVVVVVNQNRGPATTTCLFEINELSAPVLPVYQDRGHWSPTHNYCRSAVPSKLLHSRLRYMSWRTDEGRAKRFLDSCTRRHNVARNFAHVSPKKKTYPCIEIYYVGTHDILRYIL